MKITHPTLEEGSSLTAKQLAKRWHVHVITIRRWRNEGRIRALKLSSRAVRYPLAEVLRIEEEATA